jgi:hypothetical protein
MKYRFGKYLVKKLDVVDAYEPELLEFVGCKCLLSSSLDIETADIA